MKIIFAFIVPALICGIVCAAEPEYEEEDCIYNQGEQKKAYVKLQKKIPGSRYIEDKDELVIPGNAEQITIRRGGCVHFGVVIEFRTARTKQYDDERVFLSKASDLATKYGQELKGLQKFETLIESEKWDITTQNADTYYFLSQPDAGIYEMFLTHDREHTTIGISYYH
jgi:hypothetical protein